MNGSLLTSRRAFDSPCESVFDEERDFDFGLDLGVGNGFVTSITCMPGSIGSGVAGWSNGGVEREVVAEEEAVEDVVGEECAFHQRPSPLEIIVAVTVTVGAAAFHSVPPCPYAGLECDSTILRRCRRSLFMLRISSKSIVYARYRRKAYSGEVVREKGRSGREEGVRLRLRGM